MNEQGHLFSSFSLPTRKQRRALAICAVKLRYGIFTHHAPHLDREAGRWCALWIPPRGHKYHDPEWQSMTPIDLIAKCCIRLEDCGFLVTGKTEAEALIAVCKANDLEHSPL